MIDKAINAGVHATNGFELQKHCALYILFNSYKKYQNSRYFICLEHHDDFLFCFLDDENSIKKVNAFQSKKASKKWTLNSDFKILLKKILEVGISLNKDTMRKSNNYEHNLIFTSNYEIDLTEKINVTNHTLKYKKLNKETKDTVEKYINSDDLIRQLEYVFFHYIDLPQSYKRQKDTLVGMFNDIFKDKVPDPKAAIDTLLLLLRDAENEFNQNSEIKLIDDKKRVSSQKINETINMLTTHKKLFNKWRDKKDELSKIFKIHPMDRDRFQEEFINSIEYFKDLKQAEHQKIFNFVKDYLPYTKSCYTDEDCMKATLNEFYKTKNTQLNNIEIKAAIFAACIQVLEKGK